MRYKRISKPTHLRDHTPCVAEAVPYMMDCAMWGGCIFDQRHFVYDTFDGIYPFSLTCGMFKNAQIWLCIESNNIIKRNMIAKIYPDNHPDLQGKKDPTHPVRYFDIRKLTPTECYRLMGVPQAQIEKLMATEKRPYVAFVGVDRQLEVLGLEPSATGKEVADAYEDAMRDYQTQREEAQRFIDQGYQDPATRPAKDDEGEDIIYGYSDEEEYGIYLRKAQDELDERNAYL